MKNVQTKVKSVGNYVSTEHVDSCIRNYKQERWIHNTERLGKSDSLSAWLSIEELEGFIETAKMQGADGMKFYFGAYDKNKNDRPEYAGLQTLILVGTKESELNGGVKSKDIYVQTENGVNILAYNSVRLCPPSCKPTTPTKPELGGFDDMLGITIVDRGEKGMFVV